MYGFGLLEASFDRRRANVKLDILKFMLTSYSRVQLCLASIHGTVDTVSGNPAEVPGSKPLVCVTYNAVCIMPQSDHSLNENSQVHITKRVSLQKKETSLLSRTEIIMF